MEKFQEVEIGISKFRKMTAMDLAGLKNVNVVVDHHCEDERLAVVIPYKIYMEMQTVIIRAFEMMDEHRAAFNEMQSLHSQL